MHISFDGFVAGRPDSYREEKLTGSKFMKKFFDHVDCGYLFDLISRKDAKGFPGAWFLSLSRSGGMNNQDLE